MSFKFLRRKALARRSDHTREQLLSMALDVTEQLLAEQRMGEISVRQIAAKMGYTVGTLYTLYTNLNDLMMHVYARTLDRLFEDCQDRIRQLDDPTDRIRACGRAYMELANAQPNAWEMLFSRNLKKEEEHEWIEAKIGRLFAMLNGLLDELRPNKSKVEIERAAKLLWGSVHGITVLSLQDRIRDEQTNFPLTDELITCFLKGW